MPEERYATLNRKIQTALDEEPKRDALYTAMKRGRDSRSKAMSVLPGGEAFREEIHEIKKRCVQDSDRLVEMFSKNAKQRGAQVTYAEDGPQAVKAVLEITRRHNAKTVAKSKSLTSEEIHINHPMQKEGIQVTETDLGELIIQLVNEKPFHLVFPAVHKSVPEVAEIFKREVEQEIPNDANEIMRVVRKYLRPIFLHSDIGMTGANVGIAENGAIVIETNEGNARLVSSIPDVHICIMGIEKIVETIDEALKMALAHPISAVGQKLTTYVTFMAGRSPLGSGKGRKPRETHIILLDNGRKRMREDPWFHEALHCIRCGACMNICPTYGVVGGHTFGHIYPGPIGIPWTAQVHGLENAGNFAPLCISCGLCQEICPAEINIPMMIAKVKHEDAKTHGQPFVNRALMQAEAMAKMGSRTAPLSNWLLRNPAFRLILEKIQGIDRRRTLPFFSRHTLEKWMRKRHGKPGDSSKRKVAYFVDMYANYNQPELGKSVVEMLEGLGCEVVLPKQKACGYPYIGYGDLDKAKEVAEFNLQQFLPYVEQGYEIVASEPTAAFCLKHAYPKLLDYRDDVEAVSIHTFEFFEYLLRIEKESAVTPESQLQGKRFGLHLSCHQRPLNAGEALQEWLRNRGAEVQVIETGTCCGMAGTFGMKKGNLGYNLSRAVGEPLFKQFLEAEIDAIITESSVCRIHLMDGTGLNVFHPLEIIKQNE